ncbi:oligosaccharyl transferase glycoprotein complex, beta subunit [Coelomomyces lativittatus]|nr:oligosaccharyl transferase glycoprotein complex, beta subunit [Coelomomyces lativittatus]
MVHEAPTLVQYQQLKARHVIDLASSTPLTHGRSPQRILEFIEAGGNWMFMVDTNVSTLHVNFLREFGWALRRATLPSASSMTPVEFSSRMAASLLQASSSSSSSSSSSTPIPALKLSSTPMVHTVLHPDSLPHLHTWAYLSPTYVHPSSSRTPTQTVLDETQAVQVRLVSSLIARNQARISLVGCTDLIHNRNFNPEDPSSATNRRFMQTLTQFTFHELGVFRISSVTTQHVHPIKANLSEPYRIKDWMSYTLRTEVWDGQHWRPTTTPSPTSSFQVPCQLTVTLLEPYVRTSLFQETVTFRFPTQPGVYTLTSVCHLDSSLSSSTWMTLTHQHDVSVMPIQHNQFPRYLTVMKPYFTNLALQMVSCGFVLLFVFHFKEKKSMNSNEMK